MQRTISSVENIRGNLTPDKHLTCNYNLIEATFPENLSQESPMNLLLFTPPGSFFE